MDQPLRLSVEEFACAMALCGQNEAAMAYLQSTLPGSSPESFNDVMTCASHGLISRGLLEVTPDLEYGPLRSDLRQIAEAASRDALTLRCHRARPISGQLIEEFETVTFTAESAVLHWNEMRVVAALAMLPSQAEALAHISEFIGVFADNPAGAVAVERQHLPSTVLGTLRQAILQGRATEAGAILAHHLSARWTDAFLRSMLEPAAVWGDILRLDKNPDGITAERGLLFVTAAQISWLLTQDPEHEDHLEVIPATGPRLTEILADLTR